MLQSEDGDIKGRSEQDIFDEGECHCGKTPRIKRRDPEPKAASSHSDFSNVGGGVTPAKRVRRQKFCRIQSFLALSHWQSWMEKRLLTTVEFIRLQD